LGACTIDDESTIVVNKENNSSSARDVKAVGKQKGLSNRPTQPRSAVKSATSSESKKVAFNMNTTKEYLHICRADSSPSEASAEGGRYADSESDGDENDPYDFL
jgi:cell fate regulator YaaT (PSP1 superfamily)